jgi:hypothetical protein
MSNLVHDRKPKLQGSVHGRWLVKSAHIPVVVRP